MAYIKISNQLASFSAQSKKQLFYILLKFAVLGPNRVS